MCFSLDLVIFHPPATALRASNPQRFSFRCHFHCRFICLRFSKVDTDRWFSRPASMDNQSKDPQSLFIGRDESWLSFNHRVLEPTTKRDIANSERVRCRNITATGA